MRAGAPDVQVRYSLWDGIPAVYGGRRGPVDLVGFPQESFIEDLVAAFDAILAPAHVAIEDLDLYFDPASCPPDFLPWLAGWLGVALNERWPLHRRRRFVYRAAQLFRIRGTIGGVEGAIELYLGVRPTIEENGGVTWSRQPMQPIDSSPPAVTVTVPAEVDGRPVDLDLVEEIAAAAKPVHVALTVRHQGPTVSS